MVKTRNPIAMQAADKSDAVLIAVTRDGKTYLEHDAIPADQLPPKIKDMLTNRMDKSASSRRTPRAV